jgi:hypothetical protein
MTFDTSEVLALGADLGRIAGKSVPPLLAAVEKSAAAVERAMRSDAQGHAHSPHFPNSITHDVKAHFGGIEAEIGPDKGLTQGALGNILYFGTSKNGPVLNINGPLDAESPKFQKAVEDAAGKLLDG